MKRVFRAASAPAVDTVVGGHKPTSRDHTETNTPAIYDPGELKIRGAPRAVNTRETRTERAP